MKLIPPLIAASLLMLSASLQAQTTMPNAARSGTAERPASGMVVTPPTTNDEVVKTPPKRVDPEMITPAPAPRGAQTPGADEQSQSQKTPDKERSRKER